MASSPLFWLILTFLFIFAEGFYAMGEIAIISLNKVRLQYYVNKGKRRAVWIFKLLQKPSNLFGTVLLGVNIALQVGSECSRQFYRAADLNPDFAFITQFILVMVIAELAPLFAGRRYAEHVAMLQAPIIYGSSIVMRPFVWFFDLCVRVMNHLFKTEGEELGGALSREELQKIVEEQDEGDQEEFNFVVAGIFHLRSKTARQIMVPLSQMVMLPSQATMENLRQLLSRTSFSQIPLYHGEPNNIVAIATARDLVRIQDGKRIRDFSKSPWFVTEETKVTDILQQFRNNKQNVAIVLGLAGKATGLITLEDIVDEIFHDEREKAHKQPFAIIERSFPAHTLVADFNKQYNATLPDKEGQTLQSLIEAHLEHRPVPGDSIHLGRFELTVEESSLLGIKSILIRTRH